MRIVILLWISLVSSLAVGQSISVSLLPEGVSQVYLQPPRLSAVLADLLRNEAAFECELDFQRAVLSAKSIAREEQRTHLISAMRSSEVHSSVLEFVNQQAPRDVFDYKLSRVSALLDFSNNPLLSQAEADYRIEHACDQPMITVVSWQNGVTHIPWRHRLSLRQIEQRLSFDLPHKLSVFNRAAVQQINYNRIQYQHQNLPYDAIVWVHDAPSEDSDNLMQAELLNRGVL